MTMEFFAESFYKSMEATANHFHLGKVDFCSALVGYIQWLGNGDENGLLPYIDMMEFAATNLREGKHAAEMQAEIEALRAQVFLRAKITCARDKDVLDLLKAGETYRFAVLTPPKIPDDPSPLNVRAFTMRLNDGTIEVHLNGEWMQS